LDRFISIITSKSQFYQNSFRFKIKTLELKPLKNLLLMQIDPRLLTNQVFISIITHKSQFYQNSFQFKTKTLELKPQKNLLLMQIHPRLLTNQVA
jgi:hypothetical protein